ncbi:MAG: 30S ribosomal protein S11 [Candidatus Blackburnbacteria bacterium RIFCSPHIGHO2_01_FULL_43_15b]|uniref:Small ribosomal subunit protein uS11 n=1 Tax=Candidatus Blackburnbacteria bacterium RIFCSPHIGHO2_01_FULL_43_15b TaxID=1797513 RepID=A0A1G1UYV7_9BACT|nr:MAG: 30S ribosomal protein S11 [Candidatus Blackburnbacteria bacterium RIFCSPHIGHO2_01_FULL_43_15b]
MAEKANTKTTKQKAQNVPNGKVYVNATFNNTLITVTDDVGNSIASGSSGRAGFKGTRKATPYAATTAVESAIKKAKDEFGVKSVDVFIKGPGPGRDAALRAIKSLGLRMNMIADVTPMPYNGPRAKKKRRA